MEFKMNVREQNKYSYFVWNVLKLSSIFRYMENVLIKKECILSLSN